MEKAEISKAELMEMFAETNRQMAENSRQMAENRRQLAESKAEFDRRMAESRAEDDRRRAEDDRQRAEDRAEAARLMAESRDEADRQMAEIRTAAAEASRTAAHEMVELRSAVADATSAMAESRKLFDKLGIGLEGAKTELKGISTSNGMFAEEYFYNSLKEKLTFAGIHFDDADDTLGKSKKRRGCKTVRDQFDIVLTNKEAAAIIEVKYRARKEDVELLVDRKVENLRILYPEYKDYRIYLGLGSLVIDDGVAEIAKKHGVGLLRQIGETVEEDGGWVVRAY